MLYLPDAPPDLDLLWVAYDAQQELERRRLLSSEEAARLDTFGAEKRRRSFVLGRVAARTLLARRLGVDPVAVPLHVEVSGAPAVAVPATYVSISHAGDYAVAATADRPLGIDLEVIAPRHPGLARRLLHPEEVADYAQLPVDPVRRPTLLWTIKEATLKGLGTGFRRSPKTLRAYVDVAGQRARVSIDGEETVWIVRFAEHAGCFLAVALSDDAG